MHRFRPTLEAEGQAGKIIFKAEPALFRPRNRQSCGLIKDNRFGVDKEDALVKHSAAAMPATPHQGKRKELAGAVRLA